VKLPARIGIVKTGLAVVVLTLVAALGSPTSAQEMEPRSYSRAPVGSQFVVLAYGYQSGDVLTDSSLPLTDVSVKLSSGSLTYGRTFGLASRQASATVVASYARGSATGNVFEQRQQVTRSGLTDIRMRFSTMLVGSPALSPREFATFKPRTVVGVSLTVIAPTGQYDPRRLINLGSHRWSFKPEVGLSKPLGRWTMEMAAGIWLYTSNNNFFGGAQRGQKPMTSLQSSVVYTLRRRMWVSGNATYYTGGRTIVNGVTNADTQANSRIGATFSLPVSKRQSIKVAYATGLTTRFGGKLSTVVGAWQYNWTK